MTFITLPMKTVDHKGTKFLIKEFHEKFYIVVHKLLYKNSEDLVWYVIRVFQTCLNVVVRVVYSLKES